MDNDSLVRRAIDALWNRGDLDTADDLFGPDYLNHDGLITDLVRGPEAIKISTLLCRLAFPDLHVTVDDSTAEGEMVIVRWTARRSSPSGGNALNGPPLMTGTTRSRVSEGKIVESWTEWDRETVLGELGLLPPDREP